MYARAQLAWRIFKKKKINYSRSTKCPTLKKKGRLTKKIDTQYIKACNIEFTRIHPPHP